MVKKLTVADFFCGAGGFSEGFKQAGFETKFALDIWEVARITHELNHPNCEHSELNILNIVPEKIKYIIPDVHVIIGSPPCVSFSSSNCAGKADKTHGIKLVEKYFQIVAVKKFMPGSILKYWIMENVPNVQKNIENRYTFNDLGLTNETLQELGIEKKENDVAIEIDISKDSIYNSADYGVPQRRRRFFCGDFPKPRMQTPDRSSWVTLGKVIKSLDINKAANPNIENHRIIDPNYDYSILDEELTDHYYDTTIHPFEWKQAEKKKRQARYYGKMSFPEDESLPSRTIMATRSTLSRESMIIGTDDVKVYRSLTIREAATLMSFPITYQFQGDSEASKYRLVGNAVCPKLSYEFAKQIMKNERIVCKRNLRIETNKDGLNLNLRGSKNVTKVPKNKHDLSNFAEIVPDIKHNNFRVELDNNFPRSGVNGLEWFASIHHATGKESMKFSKPIKEDVRKIFNQFRDNSRVNKFISDVEMIFAQKIPNVSLFQSQNCLVEPLDVYLTPYDSLDVVTTLVNKHFPKEVYEGARISNKIEGSKKVYIEFDRGEIPNNMIPIRIIAALYALIHVVELTKKA